MKRNVYMAGGLLLAVIMLLCSCSRKTESVEKHEPVTIYSYLYIDYDEFKEELEKKYPEIELQIISKASKNHTELMEQSAAHGDGADIINSTILWSEELQRDTMLDLSGYNFTSRYNPSRLAMTTCSDGSLYMLPSYYSIYSPVYNKTLLEEHGWEVPTSFEELKALVPQIRAAGLEPFTVDGYLSGLTFQYLCDLGDTLNWQSIEGKKWQADFLAGKATAAGFVDDTVDYLQEWIDLGAFPAEDLAVTSTTDIRREYWNGSAVFLLTGNRLDRFTQNEDGTGYEFGFLPWLSPDGSNNYIITQSSTFHGLNKRLAEPGNEQKLEDALKVIDFMSTLEGMRAMANDAPYMLYPHQDFVIDEDSIYYEVQDIIARGQTAEPIYTGWDNIIVDVGNKTKEFMLGECTGEELIETMDRCQQVVLETGHASSVYGFLEETLDEDLTAQLVGRAYCEATGADCFLLPLKKYYSASQQIADSVNTMYSGPISEQRIASILPSSYYGHLYTVKMTGARLNEVAERGYDIFGNGLPFPYTVVAKAGFEIQPDAIYTVVIASWDDTFEQEYGDAIVDTGVVGMDAMKSLCQKLGTVNRGNAAWK